MWQYLPRAQGLSLYVCGRTRKDPLLGCLADNRGVGAFLIKLFSQMMVENGRNLGGEAMCGEIGRGILDI